MTPFIIYTLVVFIYCTLLGAPISLFMASHCTSRNNALSTMRTVGLGIMAPVFGIVVQLFASISICILWGLHPLLLVGIPVLCVGLFTLLAIRKYSFLNMMSLTLCLGIVGASVTGVIALLVNSTDLYHIAFNDYFPVTNGDTFAYLGYIDQLRLSGWGAPTIEYPAGFRPIIEAAFGGRDAVVAFMATIASVLHLETHTAFFISQRLILMVLVTGTVGALLFITSSVVAGVVGFIFATVGNFFLYQVLQQFSSDSMGAVLVLAVVFLLCWQCQRKAVGLEERWSPTSGFASGVLLLVSPETAVVALFVVGLWFLVVHSDNELRSTIRSMKNFLLGFLFGALPTLPQSVVFAFHQSSSAAGGRAGDWIANPAILFQASGLGFTVGSGLGSLTLVQAIGAVTTSSLYLFFILFLFWQCRLEHVKQCSPSMPVVFFSAVSLLIATVLFYLGLGYAMLKVIDYFSVLPALIFGLAVSAIMSCRNHPLRKLYLFFGTIFVVTFAALAYPEKLKILDSYASAVNGIPHLHELKLLQQPSGVRAVIPDFVGDSLDLFLYVNRFDITRFAYNASESYRYRPTIRPDVGMPFVRLSVPGYLDKIFADVTHAVPWVHGLYLVSYDNAIRVNGPGWLPPEGSSGLNMFRWLSGKGAFTLFAKGPSQSRHIRMNIYPGPDLLPENWVEVQLNGLTLSTVRSKDLPLRLDLGTGGLKPGPNKGRIVVHGPAGGIRQVSVARLVALPR